MKKYQVYKNRNVEFTKVAEFITNIVTKKALYGRRVCIAYNEYTTTQRNSYTVTLILLKVPVILRYSLGMGS